MPPTNIQQILENSGMNTTTKRQRIQAFIDRGGNINILEENGNPALLNEMTYGSEETVNLLLDLGADVNVRGKNKQNALMHSADFTKRLSLNIYKKIIDKTADLNAKNEADETALIIFASTDENSNYGQNSSKAAEVVEVLIQKGADPNIESSEKNSALIRAFIYMNYQVALSIARAPTLNLNAPQADGRSNYLIFAIRANVPEVIRTLLERGADPSSLTADGRTTPLLTAVGRDIYNITSAQRQGIIRLLLEKGADKNVYNNLRLFAYDIARLDDIGEELYAELKPTVMAPPRSRNTMYNMPTRYNNNTTNMNLLNTAIGLTPRANNNNANNANANNANNNANINANNNSERVYPINRTVANGILSTVATPRQNSRQIPISKGQTIPVYDAIEVGDVDLTTTEIENDTENIYFKVGTTYSRLPYDALNNALQGLDAIQFECKKEMTGAPRLADVYLERPYYLISTTAKYLVPLGEIVWALSDGAPHMFELLEQETLTHVSSFRSVQRPYQRGNSTILNYSGRSLDIVGKDHCTAGTGRHVYTMIPIKFVGTTGGRAAKRRKRVLRTRKNRSKKRAQSKTRSN
jgi:ankyrin repeat protein